MVSVVAWMAGFAMLRWYGTWAQFALIGLVLASVTLQSWTGFHRVLRPSRQGFVLGIGVGLVMIALTHVAFLVVSAAILEIQPAALDLFRFLSVGAYSPEVRVLLIVLTAASEEVIFRGPLLGTPTDQPPTRLLAPTDVRRVVLLAAIYAVATLPIGSPLLVLVAFGCALVWGVLRVMSRSLIAPICAHLVWDVGVLVLWPPV
jgi:membrane protease YdiL (CAAX protease family)